MQAPQSNTASGKPNLPSPFTAPIQAARKYLERQKGGGSDQHNDQHNNEHELLGRASRRQDALPLEDRFYRNHSVEAELGYEALPGTDTDGDFDTVFGTPSGEPRDLAASLSNPACQPNGPVPDPSAVRAAIFRLAQDSKWTQRISESGFAPDLSEESIPSFNLDSDSNFEDLEDPEADSLIGPQSASTQPLTTGDKASSATRAAILPVPLILTSLPALEPSAPRLVRAPASDLNGPPGGSMAFEDVALWVWSDVPEQTSSAVAANDRDLTATVSSDDGTEEDIHPLLATMSVTHETRSATDAGQALAADAAHSAKVSPTPSGLQQDDSPISATGAAIDPDQRTTEAPLLPCMDAGLAEGPALAHDANNLLSALGLYSELFCLSGVLQASHRHYAEDLKLLVGRSQVLIERLLRLSRGEDLDALSVLQKRQTTHLPFQGAAGPILPGFEGHETESAHRQKLASAAPSLTGLEVDAARNGSVQDKFPRPVVAASPDAEPVTAPPESKPDSGLRAGASALDPKVLSLPPVSLPPSSLSDLLTRWTSLLSTMAHGAVTVNFGPHAELPIAVPQESLERIVVNLVRNAAEAIRDSGAIRIGAGVFHRGEDRTGDPCGPVLVGRNAASGQRMVLRIDDSGCGMTEEQLRRVLDGAASSAGKSAGSHGETTAANHPAEFSGYGTWPGSGSEIEKNDGPSGTRVAGRRHGLGLRIVRELVAATGGEIFIQSQLGKGTRIEIQWPVAEIAAAPAPVSPTAALRAQAAVDPAHRKAVQPSGGRLRFTAAPSRLAATALRSSPTAPVRAGISAAALGSPGAVPDYAFGGFTEVAHRLPRHEADHSALRATGLHLAGQVEAPHTGEQPFDDRAKGAIAC